MITIACVLKYERAGFYDSSYVLALARGVQARLELPHRFLCLTDRPDDVSKEVIPHLGPKYDITILPLKQNLKGWWSKTEIWDPMYGKEFGRILYTDLDTFIVGSLNDIAGFDGDLCVLRDFYYPKAPSVPLVNFACGKMKKVWSTFQLNPGHWMTEGDKMIAPHFGDQILVTGAKTLKVDTYQFFQDVFPGQVVSYKIHCRAEGKPPKGARLVNCHGTPKPHEIKDPWFRREWLQLTRK